MTDWCSPVVYESHQFTQDLSHLPKAENQGAVGVDLGVSALATLSTGTKKGARLVFFWHILFMPRRPRIHLDGVPLHIVQRGHNRGPCFFGEENYHAYLHWLGEAANKERCTLHAYVPMTNHSHLLITPERADSIPRLIIALGRRSVQYINTLYRRTGTLWDSRYKSSLIQAKT